MATYTRLMKLLETRFHDLDDGTSISNSNFSLKKNCFYKRNQNFDEMIDFNKRSLRFTLSRRIICDFYN